MNKIAHILSIKILLLLGAYSIESNDSGFSGNLSGLTEGKAIEISAHSKPLIFIKPTQEDFLNLDKLDDHVQDKERAPFIKEIGSFAVWAISTKSNCKLRFVPPKSMENGNKWYGGFYDPCGDANYDMSGRTITNKEYTINNYPSNVKNLSYPKIKWIKDMEVLIYDTK
jgi:ubiquinol-cytochrome c reductase iron-sulfur subunit